MKLPPDAMREELSVEWLHMKFVTCEATFEVVEQYGEQTVIVMLLKFGKWEKGEL
jgi:hypothetical protein